MVAQVSLRNHVHFSGNKRASPCRKIFSKARALHRQNMFPVHERTTRDKVHAILNPVHAIAQQEPLEYVDSPGPEYFDSIATVCPPDLKLREVLSTLPKDVFQINELKSIGTLIVTVVSLCLGYAALASAPIVLLPAVYLFMSCAMTGLFVIGHDAGHNCFSNNRTWNDLVGILCFSHLIYPFEPWRIKHNVHHANTNMLVVDTAWQPWTTKQYEEASPFYKKVIKLAMGPFWWLASVGHQAIWHFDTSLFTAKQMPKVKVSLAAVYAYMAIVWPILVYNTGFIGFFKFWLLPNIGFHFWMSTFTLIHHTAPHIPFKPSDMWNASQAQLSGTVHCEFPKWVEALCHNINVHVPHHLSQRIPSYNLRRAHEALLTAGWEKNMNICKFSWGLLTDIVSKCHVFDESELRWKVFHEKPTVWHAAMTEA